MKSIKYNNPGRIQKGPKMFIGEMPDSTDRIYRQFYDVVWGYRAMFCQIQIFIGLQYNTVRKIVTRWEPRTRAEVEKYVMFIEENTSILADEIIQTDDKVKQVRIVSAISHFENGEIPNEKDIIKGWELLKMSIYQ